MAKFTMAQLYALAREAGLGAPGAVIAAAVAVAESGGDSDAVGDETIQTSKWGPSVGLWQIRSLKADHGTGRTRDASRLTDPKFNAQSMATISGTGGNFKPWSVYSSGAYKKHLDAVKVAAGGDGKTGIPWAGIGTGIDAATGGMAGNVAEGAGIVADAAAKLNPLAMFDGWQDDLTGVALKLAVTGAALWLVVAGVRSAAGDGAP